MAIMTNMTLSSIQPGNIAVLEKQPSTLLKAFSFLDDREKHSAQLVSKQWISLAKEPIAKNGYGDFLLIDTTGKQIDGSLYRKVFPILNDHLPQVHQKPLKDR